MKTSLVFQIPQKLERPLEEVEHKLSAADVDIKLDFAGCEFITVEGLEWLEDLVLRAGSQGVCVEFANVIPSIYKVFKIARIDSVLKACGGMAPSGPVC